MSIAVLLVWIVDHQLLSHRAPTDVARQSFTLGVSAPGFTWGWSTCAFATPLQPAGSSRMARTAER